MYYAFRFLQLFRFWEPAMLVGPVSRPCSQVLDGVERSWREEGHLYRQRHKYLGEYRYYVIGLPSCHGEKLFIDGKAFAETNLIIPQ